MARRSFHKLKRFAMHGKGLRIAIALLLVVAALVNITYAWLEQALTNSLFTDSYITVSADGLIMEGTDNVIKDSLNFDDLCENLTECSSVDGRNIYFPTEDPAASETFRKANVNDRNTKYATLEFFLTSDKDTNVWLSNESYILGGAADAIRISLDYGEEYDTYIMDASEPYEDDSVRATNAVAYVDGSGRATYAEQKVRSLAEYYYTAVEDTSGVSIKENELFTLKAGVTRKIVVTIWLEGCDLDCSRDVYKCEDLQIQLRFTAGLNRPQVLKFSDTSFESWAYLKQLFDFESFLGYAERRVFLRDCDTGTMYAMTREVKEEQTSTVTQMMYYWTVTIPGSVSNIEFIRLDYRIGFHFGDSSEESDWEFWDAGAIKVVNDATCRRFYALEGVSEGQSNANLGRWTNLSSIVTVYFHDYGTTDICDTNISFYIQYSYYGSAQLLLTMRMTYVTTLESGANVYAARIPRASISGISFLQEGATYSAAQRTYVKNVYSTATSTWSADDNYPMN